MSVSADGGPARAARSRARMAALLGAAAIVVATVPASAHARPAPAPPPASAPVVVVDCFAQAQVTPAEYLLACGDGNNRLVGLHWDTWGPQTATATGTDMVNDCTPYCAAGRFRPYPVTVTLSSPQSWPARPDVQRFTMIRLRYTDTAPSPVPKDVTYNLVF